MTDSGRVIVGALTRAEESLDRLHPDAIVDARAIRSVLERLCREAVPLQRGMNRRIEPEIAWIEEVLEGGCVVRTENFDPLRDSVFLNFVLDGRPLFLAAPFDQELGPNRIRVRNPRAIYRAERRSRVRNVDHERVRVALEVGDRRVAEASLVDVSPEGLAIEIADAEASSLEEGLLVRFLSGPSGGQVAHGEVRYRRPVSERKGWIRLGVDLSPAPRGAPLHVEKRLRVVPTTALDRAQRGWRMVRVATRGVANRALGYLGRRTALPDIRVVDYSNEQGENIRGIVDSWGDTVGATAVLIPPAWGRTKETALPLAATIVAGFRAANEPVVVLRFDGVRKRGESYRDAECDARGKEHHRFTFSQGMRDIRATLDFLERSEQFRPRRTILVSFSAASIESRRAVAVDSRINGWVCVVGASDVQSMLRVISGGIDYVGGAEKGMKFGLQEILGVDVDVDWATKDLLLQRLPYLEDARRDFASIKVPVTWIHGEHDAWMDPTRVRDAMSRGDTARRRFITVPTGHILRTSVEALETFQLVCSEVGRMALGKPLAHVLPNLSEIETRRIAERSRLRRAEPNDLREFWRRYLVGADGTVGFELMTHTSAYREVMQIQTKALQLQPGSTVIDLGSGTGAFPLHVGRSGDAPPGIRIVGFDYVREGHERSLHRLRSVAQERRPETAHVVANLDVGRSVSLPLGDESVDAVLAGFFLSYVSEPRRVLREIRRVLVRGGRLVVSSLRRDADFSKLFTSGVEELQAGEGQALVRSTGAAGLDEVLRAYLNEASRLQDFEENGRFQFWDARELEALLHEAGFESAGSVMSLGSPPQAIVACAVRR